MLQEAIDASDLIGKWEYDIHADRAYADALVALVLDIDPAAAAVGVPVAVILAGIHPEDRERTSLRFGRQREAERRGVCEYRVRSADGLVRQVLDRWSIGLDRSGRPVRASGVLIDVTPLRRGGEATAADTRGPRAALERVADHCLAARKAIHELPEPLLHRMSDMLLLEVGRMLSRLAPQNPTGGTN